MPVSIGAAPQAGFDQPLQLLQDCHRRIEHFLNVLWRVAAAATDDALSPPHRAALETALRYFREAAPRHTQDEEESLFPRLRRQGDVDLQTALARIDELESDHRRAATLHARVEALGEQWRRSGRISPSALRQLQSCLDELRALYRGHIKIEDQQIFPLAGRVLAPAQLAALGHEMQARRAHPSPDAPARQPSACPPPHRAQEALDKVEEASMGSFPASDAAGYGTGHV